jgi:predicted nucleic acid-binding protein
VTVLDTSGAVDLLTEGEASEAVGDLLAGERELTAPDVLIFETLCVLRRATLKGGLSSPRGSAAVEDIAALPVRLFSSLPLRSRAWQLRENLTVADALFVALAEELREPLATKDKSLAQAAKRLPGVRVILLPSS